MRISLRAIGLAVWVLVFSSVLAAQLPSGTTEQINAAVGKILSEEKTPSASVAVVEGGKIAFVKAYGEARLAPPTSAEPRMRYPIGSISKQFLATAVMLLAEQGKLALDDPVGKYLPSLTQADQVTIRELLSHTAGYQDYYPQDYLPLFMQVPVSPEQILDRWAKKPLDFEPGTEWQYSNTNYVAAGRIVEKVSGMPLFDFLRTRIFEPLGMKSVIDLDRQELDEADARGYRRFGFGPPRPVALEAHGWLFAAGELAMTAEDLARWDVSLIHNRILTPASFRQMIKTVVLKNGAPVNYGLGLDVRNDNGRLRVQHGGAVSGFTAINVVWPDEGNAIVVLTNLNASHAPATIARKIASLLFAAKVDPQAAARLAVARRAFDGLLEGSIDRSLLTPDADAYFTAQALSDISTGLKSFGGVKTFEQTSWGKRGGLIHRSYHITFSSGESVDLSTFITPDGKLEQCMVTK